MWIENKKSYRIRKVICVILGISVSLIFTCAVFDRQEVLAQKSLFAAQADLSEKVLRFHVLANSDNEDDQNLKLKVRDRILSYMENSMSESEKVSVDSTKKWINAHLKDIEALSEEVIVAEGYNYSVRAYVSECYFPDRRYGEVLFPKGYYEALRVEIGEAKGHNWWCVLYPSLCFMDSTCAVVTEEGQRELENVLTEDTYETVTATSGNFKIKSFFYELFRDKTDD